MRTSDIAAPGGAGRPWRAGLAQALALVVPVECAGCGQWDQTLCPRCRDLLATPLQRCDGDAPALTALSLPAWCVGAYAGALRAVVLAWKNHSRRDIAPLVLQAGRRAGRTWATQLLAAVDLPPTGGRVADLVVVPAPSGWRRRLARRLVAADLAVAVGHGVAEGLAAAAPGGPVRRVLVVDALRRRGGPRHQAGLGARGRRAGRQGKIRTVVQLPATARVLLVDDVLTTGATLAESARVLGADRVVGALVLAATPAPATTASRRDLRPLTNLPTWTDTPAESTPVAGPAPRGCSERDPRLPLLHGGWHQVETHRCACPGRPECGGR